MPVKVRVRGNKFCVVEVDSGKSRKCYPSKKAAQKYATVLNMRHAGIPPKK
uniref:Uncharacterized protein n=1 Tax=viral metagenome TaxID=1070528 RepID=A0A6M3IZL4_9ZZZZ